MIDLDKIREVIGPGGKMIKKISAETGTQIDIEDTGEADRGLQRRRRRPRRTSSAASPRIRRSGASTRGSCGGWCRSAPSSRSRRAATAGPHLRARAQESRAGRGRHQRGGHGPRQGDRHRPRGEDRRAASRLCRATFPPRTTALPTAAATAAGAAAAAGATAGGGRSRRGVDRLQGIIRSEFRTRLRPPSPFPERWENGLERRGSFTGRSSRPD